MPAGDRMAVQLVRDQIRQRHHPERGDIPHHTINPVQSRPRQPDRPVPLARGSPANSSDLARALAWMLDLSVWALDPDAKVSINAILNSSLTTGWPDLDAQVAYTPTRHLPLGLVRFHGLARRIHPTRDFIGLEGVQPGRTARCAHWKCRAQQSSRARRIGGRRRDRSGGRARGDGAVGPAPRGISRCELFLSASARCRQLLQHLHALLRQTGPMTSK